LRRHLVKGWARGNEKATTITTLLATSTLMVQLRKRNVPVLVGETHRFPPKLADDPFCEHAAVSTIVTKFVFKSAKTEMAWKPPQHNF
jgi:hypothetical protein